MTSLRHRPIPYWRRKQIAEKDAARQDRNPRTVLVGLGTQDPTAVNDWARSLVSCVYALGDFYCLTCAKQAGASAIAMQEEPDRCCSACGHPLGDAVRRSA